MLIVGWRWPCHCLTLVKTVSELESLLQGIVNHILPVLPISSITKGVVFELSELTVIFHGIVFMSG